LGCGAEGVSEGVDLTGGTSHRVDSIGAKMKKLSRDERICLVFSSAAINLTRGD
jgi:hypothetical protein